MAAKLADVNRLMVQCNKEGGDPFNFTAIVLVKKETTGIESMSEVRNQRSDAWYTLNGHQIQGQPTKTGLYIVNGKKIIVR